MAMSSRKKSKSKAPYEAEGALSSESKAPYEVEGALSSEAVRNTLRSYIDPVSRIALRGASKSMLSAYNKPEFPKRKATRINPGQFPPRFRSFYKRENLKPGAKKIRGNRSLRTVWKSIQDSARRKKYPAGGSHTVPGGGVGMRKIMEQMPNDIKIKYMKQLEKLHIAKCLAQLYHRSLPFTPGNRPFVPTNANRIFRYNEMAREGRPGLHGFQSYRQRTLLPVVAEGMARLPRNPASRRQQPIVVN